MVKVPETFYIRVPYEEKDYAKSLGAKWDKHNKLWYIPQGEEINKFSRYLSFLHVPITERGIVKKLGAKWNSDIKKWYVAKPSDYKKFEKWWIIKKFNSLYQDLSTIKCINGQYDVIDNNYAEGGTAKILLCKEKDTEFPCFKALKFYDPNLTGSDDAEAIFKKELMALQSLDSLKNIVSISNHDYCKEVGMWFIVMEYCPIDFTEIIEWSNHPNYADKKDTFKEHLLIIEPICVAMEESHKNGFIHRDLKPSNIVLSFQSYCLYIWKLLEEEGDVNDDYVPDEVALLEEFFILFNKIKEGKIFDDDGEEENDDDEKVTNEFVSCMIKVIDFGISKLKDFSTQSGHTVKGFSSAPYTPPDFINLKGSSGTSKESFHDNTETNFNYDVYSIAANIVSLSENKVFSNYGELRSGFENFEKTSNFPDEYIDLVRRSLDEIPLERPKSAIEFYDELKKIKNKHNIK
ncbi:MAG: DUF5710 domain-containing protein [Alphaproteobacteria bacterium]|nr:DUF5710 domain-containing protein [Alphaproteobacteria bacterium]